MENTAQNTEKTPFVIWLEGLESGLYPQSPSALHTPKGYCCLGVACDLYAEEKEDVSWYALENANGEVECYSILHNREVLPGDVRRWIGLEQHNPTISLETAREVLAEDEQAYLCDGFRRDPSVAGLNDRGVPFPLIAEMLRREYPELQ